MRAYVTAVADNRRWKYFVHRPGDIFVCTPPKCGTRWMQTIVNGLLWPAGDSPGAAMFLAPWLDARFEPIEEDWDDDLHAFFAGWLERAGFFDPVASYWARRDQPNLLLVYFNDMKADLEGEIRRVAAFLGIDVTDEVWPVVVERCTFERMRERDAEIGAFERRFEGGAKSFLFKGTNGRWRDVLTDGELEAYAERAQATLPPEARAWLEQGRLGG